jgi:hypothetical protein
MQRRNATVRGRSIPGAGTDLRFLNAVALVRGGRQDLGERVGAVLGHAAVGMSDVAVPIMDRPGPAGRAVGRQFEHGVVDGQAVGKVAVAAQDHGRPGFIGVQTDEITEVVIAELVEALGRFAFREIGGAGQYSGPDQFLPERAEMEIGFSFLDGLQRSTLLPFDAHGKTVLVIVRIHAEGQSNLFEIAHALNAVGGFVIDLAPQDYYRKETQGGDYRQEIETGESPFGGRWSVHGMQV